MEEIQQQTRANRERILAFSRDPEVQRLDALRAKALRDGNPVEANNIIRQINEIRRERYGLGQ